jgi:hypothetical protein
MHKYSNKVIGKSTAKKWINVTSFHGQVLPIAILSQAL